MKVLAIGNSFSVDATNYLYEMARAAGEELKLVNLYIGGCPLAKHAFNAMARARDYELFFNSVCTGFKVSIHEAVTSDHWDVITLQQASIDSPFWDSYRPHLDTLRDYLSVYDAGARLMVHQTWGYEDEKGAERLKRLGFADHNAMFEQVREAYDKMAAFLGADIIPSGRAVQLAYGEQLCRMHRDGFHMSWGAGCYITAAVWLETLFGRSAAENPFRDFLEPIPEEIRLRLAELASLAVREYKKA